MENYREDRTMVNRRGTKREDRTMVNRRGTKREDRTIVNRWGTKREDRTMVNRQRTTGRTGQWSIDGELRLGEDGLAIPNCSA
jgi:hypothetical protein